MSAQAHSVSVIADGWRSRKLEGNVGRAARAMAATSDTSLQYKSTEKMMLDREVAEPTDDAVETSHVNETNSATGKSYLNRLKWRSREVPREGSIPNNRTRPESSERYYPRT